MIFRQHYLACLSHASYLIGDERTRTAVVVDPQRDVDGYLAEAHELGLEIRHVLLTHFHADFVAGHLELEARTGATLWLGARAEPEFEAQRLADGEELMLGDVRLRALETPGHTPESTCYVVHDATHPAPWAVLTGDTLFVGDVGRPDLLVSVGHSAEDLAGQLFDSLHAKLLALPDATRVYPAHGPGSFCGRNLGSETSSTIGRERAFNVMLQPMPRADFVALLTKDQPAAPRYFAHAATVNRRTRPTLDTALERLRALSVEALLEEVGRGARVLDTRSPDAWAAGHLPGSLNVPLEGRYASWAGMLLAPDEPLVLVTPPDREREAALRLGRIGYDHVLGFLAGGAAALQDRRDLLESSRRLTADELHAELQAEEPPLVLDVRGSGEFAGGHIAGAVHVPLPELSRRLGELQRDRPMVVVCQSGYRSSVAASLLRSSGFREILDLAGGQSAWDERHATVR